ncbi:MAG: hypothetical protein IJJ41_02025 [Clostridia bacterium]|nr:hypothetical protein [Clostridia bacterium]
MYRLIKSSEDVKEQVFQCNAADLEDILKEIEELSNCDISVKDNGDGTAELFINKTKYTLSK